MPSINTISPEKLARLIGTPATPAIVDRIELYVRRFMRYMHPLAARGLWLTFIVLDWLPRLTFKSFRRLYALERTEAARLIAAMMHSRFTSLRMLGAGVRGAILSGYFDQDEVHRALAYAPIPFMTEKIALRRARLEAP